MAGPRDAKTSPVASLLRSASLKTDADRRSLIGSALTDASGPTRPIAAIVTVQKNRRLPPRLPTGGLKVLKVPNRTLLRSERQASRLQPSALNVRRSAAFLGSFSSVPNPPRSP